MNNSYSTRFSVLLKYSKLIIGSRLPILLILSVFLLGIEGTDYFTDPSKWKESRIFHSKMEKKWEQQITIKRGDWPAILIQPIHSPNKAYYYMSIFPDTNKHGPYKTNIYVYNEKKYLMQIEVSDHYLNYLPKIDWINEKLLFIRVWWGRVLGTDFIFDVEREMLIYREMINEGSIVFQQYSSGASQ